MNQGYLLSDEERKRFIFYLENNIRANDLIAGQLGDAPYAELMKKKYRVENMAMQAVVKMLTESESFSVRG